MIEIMYAYQFCLLLLVYRLLSRYSSTKIPLQYILLQCSFQSLALVAGIAEIVPFVVALLIAIFICAPLSKYIYSNYLEVTPTTEETD